MSPLWIWISGLAFAVIHSGLASDRIKDALYARGVGRQAYRLAYSILALIMTIAWLAFVHALPDRPLYHVEGAFGAILMALQLVGLGIACWALAGFDAGIFLGWRPAPEQGEPFQERGAYRYMRHPMYAGVMLALMASPVQSVNSLHLALVVCLYFIIGARLEEARMLRHHPAYADYRSRVPGFIPRVRRRPRKIST